MATLKLNIGKYRGKKYFVVTVHGLKILLDLFKSVQFEHEPGNSKDTVSIKKSDLNGKETGTISTLYKPGHADHFYFSFEKQTRSVTELAAKQFTEDEVLLITFKRYKRKQDLISKIILEGFSLERRKQNKEFLSQNHFITKDEFYWAMKYFCSRSWKNLDKPFPIGEIIMKNSCS